MRWFATWLAWCVLGLPAQADDLDTLVGEGHLNVKSWIEPDEGIAVNQQVKLYIQVATDTWFSGGTKIALFNIDNALVMKEGNFAVNGTLREQGRAWTTQRWGYVIFPARAGDFEIPPLDIEVSVSGPAQQVITGHLTTQPLQFSAIRPGPLADIESWVASPEYSIDDGFDRELEDLTPGDVITRTTTFSASDVPAMMLPELQPGAFEGITVYPDPPKLTDTRNRGAWDASRIEKTSYAIEKSGLYEIPAQPFYWWNTATASLEEITLEAISLEVGKGTIWQRIQYSDIARRYGIKPVLAALAAVVLLITILGLLIRRWLANRPGRADDAREDEMFEQIRTQYRHACEQSDPQQAIRLLYAWFGLDAAHDNTQQLKEHVQAHASSRESLELEHLLEQAYAGKTPARTDFSILKQLMKRTRPPRFRSLREKLRPVRLNLN